MATVNTTEILGSDGVAGSRNRINSNFNILGNWINNYNDAFSIDTNNGILDITKATTGKLAAKIGAFNTLSIPASGGEKASITEAGAAVFVSVTTQTLTASGAVALNGPVTASNLVTVSVGATASFNGQTNINGRLTFGPASSVANTSLVYNTGLTAGTSFPDTDSGTFPHGGGYGTTSTTPYEVTGTENIIYADLGSTGGFMISVGDGATVSALSAGLELTIINTNDAGGTIATGIQGSFYTGFNETANQGGFSTITVSSGNAYRSSIKLLWEPRIDQDSASAKGSWVVLSSTNMTI